MNIEREIAQTQQESQDVVKEKFENDAICDYHQRRSLAASLPVTFSNTIDLSLQSDYLQKYKKSSIDYKTCEINESHGDPSDTTYPGEVYHYTHYEVWKRIEEEFTGVCSCSPFPWPHLQHRQMSGKRQGREPSLL